MLFFQENVRKVFGFMYSGNQFNQEMLSSLDIRRVDGCIDSRLSYHKVVVFTQREIRTSTLKSKIEHYNHTKLCDTNKIILRSQSAYDDEIMIFSRKDGESIYASGFYKSIVADPTFYQLTSVANETKQIRIEKQLSIDMVKPFDTPTTATHSSASICDGSSSVKPTRAKRPAGLLLETESEGDEPPVGDGGAPGDSVAQPKGRVKLQARRLQPGDKGYRSLESRMLDCAVTLATRMPVPQGSPPLAPARAVEAAPGIPEFSLVPPADGQAAFSLAPVAPVVPVAPVAQDHQELMAKIYGLEKDNAVLAKTEEMLNIVVEAKNECIKQAVGRVDAKDQHIRDLIEAKDKLIDILARGSHQ